TRTDIAIAGVGLELAGDSVAEVDAVAGRDAIAEVQQVRITDARHAAGRIELHLFGGRQHPDADAIAVRYPVGFTAGSQRMGIPGSAPVFKVHPEESRSRRTLAVTASPVADAGEGHLVGARWTRQRSS